VGWGVSSPVEEGSRWAARGDRGDSAAIHSARVRKKRVGDGVHSSGMCATLKRSTAGGRVSEWCGLWARDILGLSVSVS
jgi:hypothetical protein